LSWITVLLLRSANTWRLSSKQLADYIPEILASSKPAPETLERSLYLILHSLTPDIVRCFSPLAHSAAGPAAAAAAAASSNTASGSGVTPVAPATLDDTASSGTTALSTVELFDSVSLEHARVLEAAVPYARQSPLFPLVCGIMQRLHLNARAHAAQAKKASILHGPSASPGLGSSHNPHTAAFEALRHDDTDLLSCRTHSPDREHQHHHLDGSACKINHDNGRTSSFAPERAVLVLLTAPDSLFQGLPTSVRKQLELMRTLEEFPEALQKELRQLKDSLHLMATMCVDCVVTSADTLQQRVEESMLVPDSGMSAGTALPAQGTVESAVMNRVHQHVKGASAPPSAAVSSTSSANGMNLLKSLGATVMPAASSTGGDHRPQAAWSTQYQSAPQRSTSSITPCTHPWTAHKRLQPASRAGPSPSRLSSPLR